MHHLLCLTALLDRLNSFAEEYPEYETVFDDERPVLYLIDNTPL